MSLPGEESRLIAGGKADSGSLDVIGVSDAYASRSFLSFSSFGFVASTFAFYCSGFESEILSTLSEKISDC